MRQSSEECGWRTDPKMFAAIERCAGRPFDLDLAATAESCLVTRGMADGDDLNIYLGPDHPQEACRDALTASWRAHGTLGFLNPPYSLGLYSKGLEAGTDRRQLQWLLILNWAWKAYTESLLGFTTWGIFPYAPQAQWFRQYVMGHDLKTAKANKSSTIGWSGHAALDYWRIPHRVSFLRPDGTGAANANVNTCIVQWGPNPGFVGPWTPSGRYWSYR